MALRVPKDCCLMIRLSDAFMPNSKSEKSSIGSPELLQELQRLLIFQILSLKLTVCLSAMWLNESSERYNITSETYV